jgi:hypothetical protein
MPDVNTEHYCPGCSREKASERIVADHDKGLPHPAVLIHSGHYLRERIVNPVKRDTYRTIKEGKHRIIIGVTKAHKTYVQSILHPLSELKELLKSGHTLAMD